MKILVVADIHANWPALSAIDEDFDACFVLGDLVDYGTDPAPCIDWTRQKATHAVRGNHDHAVAQRVPAKGGRGFRNLSAATRPYQWKALTRSQLKFLSRLPVTQRSQLDNLNFLMVHATPRDPLDEYVYADPEAWKLRLQGIEADIVCVGHTHLQFVLELDGRRVLNPGSVGQPRDGIPGCAYAIIDNGKIELRRKTYDISQTLDQMRGCGVEPWVIETTEHVLRTGGKLPEAEAGTSW